MVTAKERKRAGFQERKTALIFWSTNFYRTAIKKNNNLQFTLPKEETILKWFGYSNLNARNYHHKTDLACKFADKLKENGIECYVLKGMGISLYYPVSEQRPFGDFDCFLVYSSDFLVRESSAFEKGNQIGELMGGKVDMTTYKHSQIQLEDLSIENHRYISNFDKTKIGTLTEKALQKYIVDGKEKYLNSTNIKLPSIHFNAIHILKHAQDDFLYEGMLMRQVYDWAVFLKAECSNISWPKLLIDLEDCKLVNFFKVLTNLSISYLGLDLKNIPVDLSIDSKCIDSVIIDVLRGRFAFNKNENLLQKMQRVFIRRYRRLWRFRNLSSESYFIMIWKTLAFNSYIKREIELD